jgi:hypothetical protein
MMHSLGLAAMSLSSLQTTPELLVLFALNRKYPLNDKTALAEVEEFEHTPREFSQRVHNVLAQPGNSVKELVANLESVARLHREIIQLADGLYRPRYTLPK